MSRYWPYLRRAVYMIVLTALIGFLLHQGMDPWVALVSRPWTFLAVMLVTGASLFVQAYTFRMCLPAAAKLPTLFELVRAWSAGGVTGLVTPLFAGFAMRTALLKSVGVDVRDSAAATLRQTLFNIEYALLIAAVILLFYHWEDFPGLGLIFGLCCVIWWLGRRIIRHRTWMLPEQYRSLATWLLAPPNGRLVFLLWGLLVLMAINYEVSFSGFGAVLEMHESILLASLTVLVSIAAIFPNGLGILEALWIVVAHHHGLEMSDSIGLALVLRLGYLCSAILLWVSISLIRPGRNTE